jgi:hypothetical protein
MIYRQYLKRMCQGEFGQDHKKGICHILLKPENADMDNSKHIDFKKATLLGITCASRMYDGKSSAFAVMCLKFIDIQDRSPYPDLIQK